MTVYLLNDDCIEGMKSLHENNYKVDLVLTDLPYGTTKEPWDEVIPYDKMWQCLNSITDKNVPILLFGQEPFSTYLRKSNIKDYRYDYYWEKERLTNIMQVKRRPGKVIENISVFYKEQPKYFPQMVKYNGRKRTNKIGNGKLGKLIDENGGVPIEYEDNGLRYPTQVLRFKRDILTSNLHPTQKPIELLKWLILTFTEEGDTVLDFTMGSGSTGVACVETNRNFIGIENDEKYYNIAKDRINTKYIEIYGK